MYVELKLQGRRCVQSGSSILRIDQKGGVYARVYGGDASAGDAAQNRGGIRPCRVRDWECDRDHKILRRFRTRVSGALLLTLTMAQPAKVQFVATDEGEGRCRVTVQSNMRDREKYAVEWVLELGGTRL
jgi:hypothetical protein